MQQKVKYIEKVEELVQGLKEMMTKKKTGPTDASLELIAASLEVGILEHIGHVVRMSVSGNRG